MMYSDILNGVIPMWAAILVFIAFALVGRIHTPRRSESEWLLWRQNQEGRYDDG